MYIDNFCVNYVTAENSVYATSNQPVNGNGEEENSLFGGILADAINETAPAEQTNNSTAAYSVDSVPPVIKTQEASESSYVSTYYPISEAEVIPGIVDVRHVINSTDMSAKTEVERYDFIEQKFIEAFGKDFMMARNLNLPSSMFYMIGVEYDQTLGRHIGNPEQVNRQRIHGDASTQEIHDKIRDSYPAELTNRDLFLMTNQMRDEGVLDTGSVRNTGPSGRYMDTLAFIKNYARSSIMEYNDPRRMSPAERDRLWIANLGKSINIHELQCIYNIWKERGRVEIGQDTAPFLAKYTGGELGADGYFKVNAPSSGDVEFYTNFHNVMFAEFDEYDALITSRMAEIDAAYNLKVGTATAAGDFTTAGVTAGAEENLAVEEAAEMDGNMESEEGSSSEPDTTSEANPQAA